MSNTRHMHKSLTGWAELARSSKGMSNVTWGYRLWGIKSDLYKILGKNLHARSRKSLRPEGTVSNILIVIWLVYFISGKKTGVPKERNSRRIKTRLELQIHRGTRFFYSFFHFFSNGFFGARNFQWNKWTMAQDDVNIIILLK